MPRMSNHDFNGYNKIRVGLYLRAGLSKSETVGSWLVLSLPDGKRNLNMVDYANLSCGQPCLKVKTQAGEGRVWK